MHRKTGKVTICAEHCDRIFAICGDTPVDGHAVSTLYTSGKHFCEVHGYHVLDQSDSDDGDGTSPQCFNSGNRNHALALGAAFITLIVAARTSFDDRLCECIY